MTEHGAAGGADLEKVDLGDLGVPDPYPLYRRLVEHAPVHRTPMGVWLVSRYDDVATVQNDPRFRSALEAWPAWPAYAEAYLGGIDGPIARLQANMFVFADGDRHTRRREIFRRAFTARRVEQLRGYVQRRADAALDAAEQRGTSGRGTLEVVTELALPVTVGVISELLGIPASDRAACRDWAALIGETFGPPLRPDRRPAVTTAVTEATGYFRELTAHRREAPTDDLLSALARAEVDGIRLTDDEIGATALLLFNAGHETTAALIASGLAALLPHADQVARLRDEPDVVAAAVEEMLRFDAPFQYMRKVTATDVVLSGTAIPAGELVIPLIGAANRDPARFDRPDEFDSARYTGRRPAERHLSFGIGPHYCLGAALARLEAEVTVGTLLRRWPAAETTAVTRPPTNWALRLPTSVEIIKDPQ